MNAIVATTSAAARLPAGETPAPRVAVSFRTATRADLPFLDALQKRYGKALGHFPTKQFEGYIDMGAVLVADDLSTGAALGYIISRDRYLKRDELGVIYQLCVAPGAQRKFVGAALVREAFARSAYGCRLYCLWCAQDLEANYFWESLGFVPLAFRAGSDRKRRVHIFWQKRICEGDAETKWWYPFQTTGGAIRADRVVFPIPPGTHWRDVQAVAVPTATADPAVQAPRALPGATRVRTEVKHKRPAATPTPAPMGSFRFQSEAAPAPAKAPKGAKPKPRAAKLDPKYLQAARELRDRWLEHVNAGEMTLKAAGKYDVARTMVTESRPRVLSEPGGPLRLAA